MQHYGVATTLMVISCSAGGLGAQTPPTRVTGLVTHGGVPVEGVNVFVEQTLEGAISNEAGRFSFNTRASGRVDIAVQLLGFRSMTVEATLPLTEPLHFEMERESLLLAGIVVEAGGHFAGGERGASLTNLEVVSIPGARGDIARAFQTLPGVAAIDEGTGLFVRGGAAAETKVMLNDAPLLNPQRIETPLGAVATTVDPFLLDGIFFSTGAFGARFGDALSAVADLRSTGLPLERRLTAHLSLASVSARASVPLGDRHGFHLTGNLSDSRANVALNGSTRSYDRAPHGHTFSGSYIAETGAGDEVRTMLYTNRRALSLKPVGTATRAEVDEHANNFASFSYRRDQDAGLRRLSASWQSFSKNERFGAFGLDSEQQRYHLFAAGGYTATDRTAVNFGGEVDHQLARFAGTLPILANHRQQSSPGITIADDLSGTRVGGFAEVEFRSTQRFRLRSGARLDRFGSSGTTRVDPRLSLTYTPSDEYSILMALGRYHQEPDLFTFAVAAGDPAPPPMVNWQLVAGLTRALRRGLLRVEAYHKKYDDLVAYDDEYRAVVGGVGRARGIDVFGWETLPGEVQARIVYSVLDAERTDPRTGTMATAPHDVTHNLTLIAEKTFNDRWTMGTAYRYATGAPYTPVVGAALSADGSHHAPHYGAPYADRFPDFHRFDLSGSYLHRLAGDALFVVYASAYNLFEHRNTVGFQYNADFSEATPVRSQLRRGVFFGASLSF